MWLQLEEKRIPYRVEKINLRCYGDKPASFFQINPSGGLPVATIKGRTISESNDIMMELERQFPHHKPLIPSDQIRFDALMKLEVEHSITYAKIV